jgi:hypothetical protein
VIPLETRPRKPLPRLSQKPSTVALFIHMEEPDIGDSEAGVSHVQMKSFRSLPVHLPLPRPLDWSSGIRSQPSLTRRSDDHNGETAGALSDAYGLTNSLPFPIVGIVICQFRVIASLRAGFASSTKNRSSLTAKGLVTAWKAASQSEQTVMLGPSWASRTPV